MRKALTALAAVGLVAATIAVSTTNADARHRRWVGPAIVGGLAAGIIGSALLAPRYYGEPVYAEPEVCFERDRVWVEGRGWRWRRVQVPCY
jgi:hypothetical protein